jgi:hypothetical protein
MIVAYFGWPGEISFGRVNYLSGNYENALIDAYHNHYYGLHDTEKIKLPIDDIWEKTYVKE